jgi:WD repeat-containing protein 89
MRTFKETASTSLNLPPDSYIYSFASLGKQTTEPASPPDRLAVVSSDDSVRLFDSRTLRILPDGVFENVNKSVTSIRPSAASDRECTLFLTAGRDGVVRGWDLRTGAKAIEFSAPKGQPLSALDCNPSLNAVVAGMELEGNPPGEVSIFGWDVRKPDELQLNYAESHTDTITELRFVPPSSGLPLNYLLSGSTDGLVTVFDTAVTDEDDAVFQVVNHRSAVHHAGFVGSDLFAMGTDETLSFYAKQDPAIDIEDVHFGDLREKLQCDYMANIIQLGNSSIIASGKHGEEKSQQFLDLVRLTPPADLQSLLWAPDLDNRIRLAGGHTTEVIRDVIAFEEPNVVFTCGEDGMVRQWMEQEVTPMDAQAVGSKKRIKGKERRLREGDGKFKPY